jgi:hypothetical protein
MYGVGYISRKVGSVGTLRDDRAQPLMVTKTKRISWCSIIPAALAFSSIKALAAAKAGAIAENLPRVLLGPADLTDYCGKLFVRPRDGRVYDPGRSRPRAAIAGLRMG